MSEHNASDRSTAAEELAPRVLEILQAWRGSGRTLDRDAMAHRLHTSERIVRVAIADLRKQGYLIIAEESGGYRFARNAEEVLGFTASLKSRIVELRQVVLALEAAAAHEWPADLQMRMQL